MTQAVAVARLPAGRTGSGWGGVLSSADVLRNQNLNPPGGAVPAEGTAKSSSDSRAPACLAPFIRAQSLPPAAAGGWRPAGRNLRLGLKGTPLGRGMFAAISLPARSPRSASRRTLGPGARAARFGPPPSANAAGTDPQRGFADGSQAWQLSPPAQAPRQKEGLIHRTAARNQPPAKPPSPEALPPLFPQPIYPETGRGGA